MGKSAKEEMNTLGKILYYMISVPLAIAFLGIWVPFLRADWIKYMLLICAGTSIVIMFIAMAKKARQEYNDTIK